MKKEKLLKSILIMVVSVAIITTMSAKAFALTDDSIFANNDLTGTEQSSGSSTSTGTGSESSSTSTGTSTGTSSGSSSTGTSTNTGTSNSTSTSTGSSSSTNTSTSGNSYNTDLPKAGLEENTLLAVAVVALAGVAVFAYRKVNYYKNI